MIGPGLAIDTGRYFILCVNPLGSCFGSTGPRSVNPATGAPYRLSFPELSHVDPWNEWMGGRAGKALNHPIPLLLDINQQLAAEFLHVGPDHLQREYDQAPGIH